MPITIVIPKESQAGEERVGMTTSLLNKLSALQHDVKVQHDAGSGIYANDAAYKNTAVISDANELYAMGDIVIKVLPPSEQEVASMKNNAVLISFLYPHNCPEVVKKLCEKNITSFAMEMIPRISRAQ